MKELKDLREGLAPQQTGPDAGDTGRHAGGRQGREGQLLWHSPRVP